MLNIRAKLRNLRTNQTYVVNHVPAELAKLQIKGVFNIKFPFGFNCGISAEKVRFVKAERQLLLSDYETFGVSANWELIIFYSNLTQPLIVVLDFTDLSFDAVSLEIGFKITPLVDRCRNFEKFNEFVDVYPETFLFKTVVPQNIQASFLINQLTINTKTIAGLKSDGLIDADGLEYNVGIPNKNDAIAIFRVTRKTSTQSALYFNLSIDFQRLNIRMWELNGTITLRLKVDYLFYYNDGTYEYVNVVQSSCQSATYNTTTSVKVSGVFPKSVDFNSLPSDPNKTLADAFVVSYLQVEAPTAILLNAIRIKSDHIYINHNFIQTDDSIKGVRMSNYLRKINELSGDEPIFDESLFFMLNNIVITSTNFMRSYSRCLQGKLMDVLEALSITAGFSFIEINKKYYISTINMLPSFGNAIEIEEYTDVNCEPIEQAVDFEIGEKSEVSFKVLPRLFESRKYYLNVDTVATLDTFSIVPKVIVSGEYIINKYIKKTNDDDLIFLMLEQSDFGSFGTTLNQFFSNQNIINRIALLLNSFFTTQVSTLYYRNNQNQIFSHNLNTTNRLFSKNYRNITIPASSSIISALFSTYKLFIIDGKKYLPVEYSLNLEPNVLNIKLLEILI